MMTKIAFWLCILSVAALGAEPRFAVENGEPVSTPTPTPTEKAPATRFAVDHGAEVQVEASKDSSGTRPPPPAVDPNAPSDASEPLVPNPLKVMLTREQRAHIRQVNFERSKVKVTPPLNMLAPAPSLMEGAQGHSQDMRDRNYFAHKPSRYLPGNGMRGENIAAGNASMLRTMNEQWMVSTGHKQNILSNQWAYIGVGHASGGGNYGEYWTQNFSSLP